MSATYFDNGDVELIVHNNEASLGIQDIIDKRWQYADMSTRVMRELAAALLKCAKEIEGAE